MRRALVAALIVLGVSVHAQDNSDPFDTAVALQRAWAILTSAIEGGARNDADRNAAIGALVTVDTPRARDLIERIALDKSHPLRSRMMSSLPTADSTYLPIVAEGVQDPDLQIRRSAIQKLGVIRDSRALPFLQNLIMGGDADTAESAIESARLLGPMTFGVLLESLETGGERTREAALRCMELLVSPEFGNVPSDNLEALRRLHPERILTKALGDSNSAVRAFAALILARLGNDAGADELIRMSTAADPKFGTIVSRHFAMAALHALGRPAYLPARAAALAQAEQRVRLDAAFAMRSFAHPSMYDSWNSTWRGTAPDDVRYWAFHGLIAIRGNDRALLRDGLVDREPGIRLRAAERLLALGRDAASLDVLEGLAAEEPGSRNLALSFLSAKGDPRRTAKVALSLLPKSVEEFARMRAGHVFDPEYRLAAVYTLGKVQAREAVPDLYALLGQDAILDLYVVRALTAIGDDTARRALVLAMGSPQDSTRIQAAGGVITLSTR